MAQDNTPAPLGKPADKTTEQWLKELAAQVQVPNRKKSA
jgi:hypothetical protein